MRVVVCVMCVCGVCVCVIVERGPSFNVHMCI